MCACAESVSLMQYFFLAHIHSRCKRASSPIQEVFTGSERGGLGGGKISALSAFQLLSGQTIYDGPATIELQSFSVFFFFPPLCFDAVHFQTELDGTWVRRGGELN